MELFRGSARIYPMAIKKSTAATKADLGGVQTALKSDMDGLRTELKSDMDGMGKVLKSDMDGLRTEIKSDMDGLRTELKSDMEGVRAELRAEMREGFRRAALADDRLGVRVSRMEEALTEGLAGIRNDVARLLDASASRMETLWRETVTFPAILDDHGRRIAALEARRAP